MYEEELLVSEKVLALKMYNKLLFVGTDKGLIIYKIPSFHKINYNIDEALFFQDVVDIRVLFGDPDFVILLVQHKHGWYNNITVHVISTYIIMMLQVITLARLGLKL